MFISDPPVNAVLAAATTTTTTTTSVSERGHSGLSTRAAVACAIVIFLLAITGFLTVARFRRHRHRNGTLPVVVARRDASALKVITSGGERKKTSTSGGGARHRAPVLARASTQSNSSTGDDEVYEIPELVIDPPALPPAYASRAEW